MQPVDSPFSNLTDLREIPYVLDGTFAWLTQTPTHDEWSIGDRCANDLPEQLNSAVTSSQKHGFSLPSAFILFIRTPELHKHLRSATACYLNLAKSVLPFADGFLLRFLHDQQDCAFWYLYLNADASDHCVVSSYEYFDADDMDEYDFDFEDAGYKAYKFEDIEEKYFHVWETSFERFMVRLWLENEIWFAQQNNTSLPNMSQKFIQMYSLH